MRFSQKITDELQVLLVGISVFYRITIYSFIVELILKENYSSWLFILVTQIFLSGHPLTVIIKPSLYPPEDSYMKKVLRTSLNFDWQFWRSDLRSINAIRSTARDLSLIKCKIGFHILEGAIILIISISNMSSSSYLQNLACILNFFLANILTEVYMKVCNTSFIETIVNIIEGCCVMFLMLGYSILCLTGSFILSATLYVYLFIISQQEIMPLLQSDFSRRNYLHDENWKIPQKVIRRNIAISLLGFIPQNYAAGKSLSGGYASQVMQLVNIVLLMRIDAVYVEETDNQKSIRILLQIALLGLIRRIFRVVNKAKIDYNSGPIERVVIVQSTTIKGLTIEEFFKEYLGYKEGQKRIVIVFEGNESIEQIKRLYGMVMQVKGVSLHYKKNRCTDRGTGKASWEYDVQIEDQAFGGEIIEQIVHEKQHKKNVRMSIMYLKPLINQYEIELAQMPLINQYEKTLPILIEMIPFNTYSSVGLFISEIIKAILFHKEIAPLLTYSPIKNYYDLYEEFN